MKLFETGLPEEFRKDLRDRSIVEVSVPTGNKGNYYTSVFQANVSNLFSTTQYLANISQGITDRRKTYSDNRQWWRCTY